MLGDRLDSKLVSRVLGTGLMAYGFIVFADEAVSELIDQGALLKGNAYYRSPLILGSNWGWPGSGVAATYGLLITILGFFVLRMRADKPDVDFFHNYVLGFIATGYDALMLFFAWSLVWTLLLSVYQPGVMYTHVTQYLSGTGITNTFVMEFSAVALAGLSVYRLRQALFGWLPQMPRSRGLTRAVCLLTILAGVALITITVTTFNPWRLFGVAGSSQVYCSQWCEFEFKLDFLGWISGCVFLITGFVASMEEFFPREPPLW